VVDPVAAAITSIDFDHQQYLGNTLAAIAAEKAGVIRPGIPVVIGTLHDEARTVVVAACKAAGADLVEADQSTQLKIRRESGGLLLHITTPMRSYGWIKLGLRGDHQAANAVVAVRLLESLARIIPIGADAIVTGLRDVRWPGRLQMLEVPGGRRVLLDAAHNPAGAWTLASYLKREFPEPLPLVFAAMQDKDVALMLKTLLPVVSRCIMTEPATPRAHRSADLAAIARRLSASATIDVEPDPKAALERAWRSCPLACAAGSIFLIGEILAVLGSSARDL
jgi:dihydrofolate synthase/folylpolyglutamate synthase